jgi:predicted small integral membrane protein
MWEWIHAQWQVFLGVGIFVVVIPIIAVIDVVWELAPRRGFIPLESTLGLRYFIGMMALIFIHIAWLLIVPSLPIFIPFFAAVILLFVIMIWG